MDDKKTKRKKKPFNHVLEVQNGFIDVADIIRHIDKNLPRIIKEAQNGRKIS